MQREYVQLYLLLGSGRLRAGRCRRSAGSAAVGPLVWAALSCVRCSACCRVLVGVRVAPVRGRNNRTESRGVVGLGARSLSGTACAHSVRTVYCGYTLYMDLLCSFLAFTLVCLKFIRSPGRITLSYFR